MRVVFVAIAAAVLGAVGAAVTVPFLWAQVSRARVARTAVHVVSAIAVFIDLFIALTEIAEWAHLTLTRTQESAVCTAIPSRAAQAIYHRIR
jgi:hypothetical protein